MFLFLFIDVVDDMYASQCQQHRTLAPRSHFPMDCCSLCFAAQDAILSGKGSHASVDMQAFCRGKVRNVSVMEKGMLRGGDVK